MTLKERVKATVFATSPEVLGLMGLTEDEIQELIRISMWRKIGSNDNTRNS